MIWAWLRIFDLRLDGSSPYLCLRAVSLHKKICFIFFVKVHKWITANHYGNLTECWGYQTWCSKYYLVLWDRGNIFFFCSFCLVCCFFCCFCWCFLKTPSCFMSKKLETRIYPFQNDEEVLSAESLNWVFFYLTLRKYSQTDVVTIIWPHYSLYW